MRVLASYGAAAAADRLASMYDMYMHVRGLGSAERAVFAGHEGISDTPIQPCAPLGVSAAPVTVQRPEAAGADTGGQAYTTGNYFRPHTASLLVSGSRSDCFHFKQSPPRGRLWRGTARVPHTSST